MQNIFREFKTISERIKSFLGECKSFTNSIEIPLGALYSSSKNEKKYISCDSILAKLLLTLFTHTCYHSDMVGFEIVFSIPFPR